MTPRSMIVSFVVHYARGLPNFSAPPSLLCHPATVLISGLSGSGKSVAPIFSKMPGTTAWTTR